MDRSLKVLSLNVNGLASNTKRYWVLTLAKKMKVDILCLQETHRAQANNRPLLCSQQWGLIAESKATNKARGVTILCNANLRPEVLSRKKIMMVDLYS